MKPQLFLRWILVVSIPTWAWLALSLKDWSFAIACAPALIVLAILED